MKRTGERLNWAYAASVGENTVGTVGLIIIWSSAKKNKSPDHYVEGYGVLFT